MNIGDQQHAPLTLGYCRCIEIPVTFNQKQPMLSISYVTLSYLEIVVI